jgi:hypothetical protein
LICCGFTYLVRLWCFIQKKKKVFNYFYMSLFSVVLEYIAGWNLCSQSLSML